jgi:endo-1,4-beta-xylanase
MRKASLLGALMLLALAATLTVLGSIPEFKIRNWTTKEYDTQPLALHQAQLSSSTQSANMTLRSLAEKRRIGIGTAVLMEPFRNDSAYREVLAREFNRITPENAMKFGRLHPERSRYEFADSDALVTFAKANQMQVHGHTLVWHRNLPDWLKEGEWTREELMDVLRQHIHTVVSRFRGEVASWDVVNEAVDNNGSLRDTIWLQVIGSDYIEIAFRWAHEADPQAQLFYNDYKGEELGKKADAIYKLLKDLRQRHVPIHGIGLQMHKDINNPPNPEEVAANIKRLGELGLEVQITEMDVRIHDGKETIEQKLASQADVYQEMMRVCLDAPNCKSLTTWGLADHHSWIPYFFKLPDSPLIFDKSYRPKPAYDALVEVLKGNRR